MKKSMGGLATIALMLTACASTSEKSANLSNQKDSRARAASTLYNAGSAHRQHGAGQALLNSAIERSAGGSARSSR
ncbi:hypothetical protein [Lysobacter soyae]|uniref:Lipoprotein n=1 Tax=Lysobacter soyae TaxID=2764185 RepID=A0ABX8WRC9_9GAMM|nr:hypothetical protein [Lysobacter sp. CJ11]QYR53390.1 hypothetical protein H8L67_02440 [Lysobacter sp. CJ11]